MRFTASLISVLIVGATTLGTAANQTVSAQAEEAPRPDTAQAEKTTKPTSKKKVVKVRSGDTLVKIAKQNKSTYLRVYYANKNVENPDLIYPGEKLRIPTTKEKLKKRALPKIVVAPKVTKVQKPAAPPVTRAVPQAPRPVFSAGNGSVWDRLAMCESGGNWAINTGNGYYGGLQFTLSSWRAVGGQGYPHQASREEQINRGIKLQAIQGWGAWPACTAKLGIR